MHRETGSYRSNETGEATAAERKKSRKLTAAVGITVVAIIVLIVGIGVFAILPQKKDKLVYHLGQERVSGGIRVYGGATAMVRMEAVRLAFTLSSPYGETTVWIDLGDLEKRQSVVIDRFIPTVTGAVLRFDAVHAKGPNVGTIGLLCCVAGIASIFAYWIVFAVAACKKKAKKQRARQNETCIRAPIEQFVELQYQTAERLFTDPMFYDKNARALDGTGDYFVYGDGETDDWLFLAGQVASDADDWRALYAAVRKRMADRLYTRMGEERAAIFRKGKLKGKIAFYRDLPFAGDPMMKAACFYAVYDAYKGTNAERYEQFLVAIGGRTAR